MDVVANNIANVNTTRTAEGGPYRRQVVVFEPRREESQFLLPFSAEARRRQSTATGAGVKVVACETTMRAMKLTKDDMNAAAAYVPAGVVEIMKREGEGWAYIRP